MIGSSSFLLKEIWMLLLQLTVAAAAVAVRSHARAMWKLLRISGCMEK